MKNKSNYINHLLNFLAVILGVFLAFYISDKAEINQDKKESRMLLESLANEINNDIETYTNYQIPDNENHIENLDKLIVALAEKNIEKINEQLPAIFNLNNYRASASTYSSIKASGKLKLIENFDLRRSISVFYEGVATESKIKGEFQVDFFKTELLPWAISNMDLMEMRLLDDYDKIILKNKIIIYKSLILQKVDSYKMIVEESVKLKAKIDSVLEFN